MPVAYFISDTHLGARGADERRLVEWLEAIAPEKGSLYLLGDMIDFWWEWRSVAPQGHLRFLGTLARMADNGWQITWLKGNHDMWMAGYLEHELGIRVIDGALEEPILGSRFFLEHGDGVGRLPRSYAMLRRLFRNKLARKAFSALHPRWAMAVATGWSRQSRDSHPARPADKGCACESHPGPLIEFASACSLAHPEIRHFIFGHYHHPLTQSLPGGRADITVLGDCLDGRFSFARFDGKELTLACS